ncbi:MAG TPA: PD-(D/E)XK nuclease family protein [Phototrophicaceae bacterium]|nr:PD-(D/E)XK nuclease family protein [Phototrophicaceae bacterium]
MSNLPTALPEMFVFDQSKLQDFVDCPRRFYLKYVRQLRYPAPESAPLREFEQQMERGSQFHHLVHQHLVGIPADMLEDTISDDAVGAWWDNYLAYGLADLPPTRLPETILTVPLAGKRLVARFDLLATDEQRAVIVDWKTALHRPKRAHLEHRLQTIVYRYVLARAKALAPEAITMIYWFAEFPRQPEIFAYSAEQFARDEAYLNTLATDILARAETDFPLTENLDFCRFCSYRSLNERGAKAGNLLAAADENTDSFDIDLDLDQIAEIEF